jgi:hypothetical protein
LGDFLGKRGNGFLEILATRWTADGGRFLQGASQNVVLIIKICIKLNFNLPKSLLWRDLGRLKVPPLEGFREVKVDERQNEMHPFSQYFKD